MKPVSLSGLSQDHHAEPTDAMRKLLKQPAAPYLEPTKPRLLMHIALDVRKHWPTIHYAAKPYLDAMACMTTINDTYGADDARSIVNYFLSNAKSFRGEDARRIKAELNAMLK